MSGTSRSWRTSRPASTWPARRPSTWSRGSSLTKARATWSMSRRWMASQLVSSWTIWESWQMDKITIIMHHSRHRAPQEETGRPRDRWIWSRRRQRATVRLSPMQIRFWTWPSSITRARTSNRWLCSSQLVAIARSKFGGAEPTNHYKQGFLKGKMSQILLKRTKQLYIVIKSLTDNLMKSIYL